MKRFACLAALLGLFVLSATAADPTIKDVMKRAHMGNTSLLPEIGRDLKADPPDWADVQKHVKELNVLALPLRRTLAQGRSRTLGSVYSGVPRRRQVASMMPRRRRTERLPRSR
jgi:hypothetical protein